MTPGNGIETWFSSLGIATASPSFSRTCGVPSAPVSPPGMTSQPNYTYNQIGFALEILRLLAEQPRYRNVLANVLSDFLDRHGKPSEDPLQKLSGTIRKLKDCGFNIKSAPNRPYELVESSFPVILSVEQRQALTLAANVLSDMGFPVEANQILRIGNIDYPAQNLALKADFSPPADYSDRHLTEIRYQLEERHRQKSCYVIRYKDSQGSEQNYDLGNSELRYHDGTLYLLAYVPNAARLKQPPRHLVEHNRLFRLDRIISVGAPAGTLWPLFNFPSIAIRYQMTGLLKTYEPRRGEKVLYRNLEAGFVEIESVEDCIFWFRQRIFRYGKNVRVLAPQWLVDDIRNELKQAYENYGELAVDP